MSDDDESREHETTIEIDAPADVVWRAISEGEELTRWFAKEAKSTPGVGGSIWVRWSEDMELTMSIVISDPSRHLRLEGSKKLATDFHLEAQSGGRTKLRIVASGFGADASWDSLYDGTRKGWLLFALTLKHYIERHHGRARSVVNVFGGLPATPEQVFDAFVREVEPIAERRGETIAWVEPRLGDGFGTAEILEAESGGSFVTVTLSAFGEPGPLDELEREWQTRFSALRGEA